MAFSRAPRFEISDLCQRSFEEAGDLMLSLVEEVAAGSGVDHLLLCEFPPVLTVGRGAHATPYEGLGLPVHEVSRGGKATFHGPGQIVAYPIVQLLDEARDLHAFLHALEEGLILTVADFGLSGRRDPRNTGCWVEGRKIASVGVAVRRWVTYHGLALNVTTDLDWFRRFDPCGLEPDLMTTMARELGGRAPAMEDVKESLARNLERVLRS